jgi:hypothetical protein
MVKALITLLLIFAATGNALAEEAELKEYPAKLSSRDVKVPNRMVADIEREYRKFLKLNNVTENTPIVRQLLNVFVDFTQERPAALHENLRILTPIGGGVIDMQEFVTPLKGAFRARITFEKTKGSTLNNVHVYYISRAQRREVEGDQFGAGCGRYFDITQYFSKKLSHEGVEVFTADQRYVSVLAGTIVLVSFEKEALYVGSVTFEDGRFPALQCDS